MIPTRAAAAQFNHAASDKTANIATMREMLEQASADNVNLLCFPEMCVTGYWHVRNLSQKEISALAEPIPDGPTCTTLIDWATEFGITVGAGLIEITDSGELFNSYVVAMSDGTFAVHRKLHCFISEHMSSGNSYTVFDTPEGSRLGILICWDNNLVENVRATALAGAEILLAPHQTGGCNSRSPDAMGLIDPALWHNRHNDPTALRAEYLGPKGREWLLRWLPARAHDNGLFLVFANGVGLDDDEVRTGTSMILDPYGKILAESDALERDLVVADLDPNRIAMSTGRRWLRGRRPELYGPLTESVEDNMAPREARFSNKPTS